MIDFFRFLFDWKKAKAEIADPITAQLCAAANRHDTAANSFIGLMCDIQQHGPIVETPELAVEPIYKLQ